MRTVLIPGVVGKITEIFENGPYKVWHKEYDTFYGQPSPAWYAVVEVTSQTEKDLKVKIKTLLKSGANWKKVRQEAIKLCQQMGK